MTKHRFERLHHGEVILDMCFSCQGIWFDEFESVQITPGGVVELFKLLHDHHDDQRTPLRDPLKCPRCSEKLLHGLDVAKHGGKFNYHRCLQKHGRFTTFAQFMIEKGFVRQLNPAPSAATAAAPRSISARTTPAAIAGRRSPSSTRPPSNRRSAASSTPKYAARRAMSKRSATPS